MKGTLIICEGLDCSGKTTAINEILKQDKRFVYSKGMGSKTWIGKLSKKFHSTFMFFIELIYITLSKIKPNLKKGKIILQDRYDISITSHIPLTNRFYNKLLIKIFKQFIIQPNAIIYFHLPLKKRLKRLIAKGEKHELLLAKNPELIILREREYLKWFNNFNGPKLKINTKKNNIKQTSIILKEFVLKSL